MNTDDNQQIISLGQYFWGKVEKVGILCNMGNPNDTWVQIVSLEGKQFQYSDSSRPFTLISARSASVLQKGDRGLFLLTSNLTTFAIPTTLHNSHTLYASHVEFGDTVDGQVVDVDKFEAKLFLSRELRNGERTGSGIQVFLSKNAYALNPDGSAQIPELNHTLKDLVVEKVDPRRKTVYVSLQPRIKRTANVQQSFDKGHAVQILIPPDRDHKYIQVRMA